ncbi:uncharacterized protein PHACADRAFT_265916 [Phanerochaete carnosa HHB-10118-sp]|uniref:SnoaL-like domain-containing protein n=1 Tax=Phanerochaete carnosa (strain HHB-10118-sp) TaxID=650164 RepID=K5VQI9_PHACS|nr:uncharacterized protein PHACADRAFT_265916 [Phanerochaete carnosa HHB-10118-sp]EKM49005.1 hypothetical protein PHACADRAFT_265916 [Phanerochaete carnosa HHB-10118-sp]
MAAYSASLPPAMTLSRSQLLASAQALCNDIARKAALPDLFSHFSTKHENTAYEHGEPFLAPFLGRAFKGRSGPGSLEAYFILLVTHLSYEDMSFGEWIVDTEAKKVSCVGSAKFTWIEGAGKGNSWNEKFVYNLDFDDEGKMIGYQIWSDSGAAYLAWKGELNSLREKFGTDA